MPKSSSKSSSPKASVGAKAQAEARFRELIDEVKLLTVAFPHLKESFDADELPVAFIMKRDSRRTKMSAQQRRRAAK